MTQRKPFFKPREDMDKQTQDKVLRNMEKMEKKFKVHYVYITDKVRDSWIAYDICFNRNHLAL
jgi:hypothetical protein